MARNRRQRRVLHLKKLNEETGAFVQFWKSVEGRGNNDPGYDPGIVDGVAEAS